MEDNNKMNHPDGCKCMNCGGQGMGCMHSWRCGCGHRLLRLVLGLIILAFVFSVGVKIGELKAFFGGEHGWGMMNGYYGVDGYGSNMMRGYNSNQNYYGPGMMRGSAEGSTTTAK